MSAEEGMNRRGKMRKGGEEVRLRPCISEEIPQPDSERKNDGEIKRGFYVPGLSWKDPM